MPDLILFLLHVLLFVLGASVVFYIIISAVRTFVLPRSAPDRLTRVVFIGMRVLFGLRMQLMRDKSYERRDEIMAFYAPFTLLILPVFWLTGVLLGYMLMFWAIDVNNWYNIFKVSGSSLFTLGFSVFDNFFTTALVFSEAAIGLFLVAVLISYLPTMYSAFSHRETSVTMLEVRAGSPPSAIEMIRRYHHLNRLEMLGEQWPVWEQWFVEIDETHTSLAPLAFFRSPQPQRSWVNAAGTILDAASLAASTLDISRDSRADLCIRAGYLALQHIAAYFQLPFDPHPAPDDPISVTRAEFDLACEQLIEAGVALKADRDQAWRDFAGWRVNYDTVLLSLASLTMAPMANWSSDRSLGLLRRFLTSHKRAS